MMLMMSRKNVVGESSGKMMLWNCLFGFVLLIVVVLISVFGIDWRFVRKNRKL